MIVSRKHFEAELSMVSLSNNERSTIDALKHVLIEGSRGACKLTATDVETTTSGAVECNEEANLVAFAPTKSLLALVRSLPQDEIEFHATASRRLAIRAKGHKSDLPCLFPEDFPRAKEDVFDPPASVQADQLLSLIRGGGWCWEPNKPPEAFEVSAAGDSLVVCSTNYNNAAAAAGKIEEPVETPFSALIGVHASGVIESLCQRAKTLSISVGKSQVKFEDENLRSVLTQKMDIKFPEKIRDRMASITEFDATAEIEREEFLDAMKRLLLFADRLPTGKDILVRFGSELTMSAGSPDHGAITETIRSAVLGGVKVEIAFSAQRIADGLRRSKGEKVLFRVLKRTEKNPHTPALMTNADAALGEWYFMSSSVHRGGAK